MSPPLPGLRLDLRALPLYLFAVAVVISVAGANLGAGLLLLCALGLLLLDPADRSVPPKPVLVVVAAYLAIHALATGLAAPLPVRWDKWLEEMWMKLLLLAVPPIVASRKHRAETAMKILIGVGCVAAVYGVFQYFTGLDLIRHKRVNLAGTRFVAEGFFDHHLSYGGSMMLLWLGALAWTLHAPGRSGRGVLLRWGAVLLCGLGLLASLARSAQLGAMAGALLLIAALPRRKRLWLSLLLGVAVGASLLSPTVIRERLFHPGSSYSDTTRLHLWESSLRGIQARPWLGWGEGNFDRMLEEHAVEGSYESRAHAHNDFLMHAVNAGAAGLAIALALLVIVSVLLWHRRDRAGPYGWIALAGVAAEIGISVGGLFQVYQTDDEVEALLYFMLGLALAVTLRTRSSDQVT